MFQNTGFFIGQIISKTKFTSLQQLQWEGNNHQNQNVSFCLAKCLMRCLCQCYFHRDWGFLYVSQVSFPQTHSFLRIVLFFKTRWIVICFVVLTIILMIGCQLLIFPTMIFFQTQFPQNQIYTVDPSKISNTNHHQIYLSIKNMFVRN